MFASRSSDFSSINKQIELVSHSYEDLVEIDKKLAIPAMIAIYFWIRSNAGMIELTVATGISVYALSASYKERVDAAKKFREELRSLAELFYKMTSLGIEVTHDETFLNMLEILAPFIAATEDLLPKGFKEAKVENLSPRFVAILARAPHQVAFLNVLNQQRYNPSLFSRISSYFVNNTPVSAQQNVTVPAASIQQELMAKGKLTIYGFQSIAQLVQNENFSISISATKLMSGS